MMTSALTALLDVLDSLNDYPDVKISENNSEYRARGLWSARLIGLVSPLSLIDFGPNFSTHIIDATDTPVDFLNGQDLEGRSFEIVIKKSLPSHIGVFFTIKGFKKTISDQNLLSDKLIIFINADFEAFRTTQIKFIPISQFSFDASQEHSMLEIKEIQNVEIRKLIRILSPGIQAPIAWLWTQVEPLDLKSDVIKIVTAEASKQLSMMLVNEIWEEPSGIILGFNSIKSFSRRRKVELKIGSNESYEEINSASVWILENPKEAVMRHLYFTTELAREWPVGITTWDDTAGPIVANALEGAKALFQAQLLETSAETIKAMAELRKALNEDVGKMIDRSTTLTTTMATNFAAIIGLLILRLPSLIGSADKNGFDLSHLIFYAMALWIDGSMLFSIMTQRKFIESAEEGKQHWHSKLSPVISMDDYKKLVEGPLTMATNTYKKGTLALVLASIFLSYVMIALADNWMNCLSLFSK